MMTTYPQLLVNVRVKTKHGWEENEAIRAAIAEGERVLGGDGRVLRAPLGYGAAHPRDGGGQRSGAARGGLRRDRGGRKREQGEA